MRRTLTIAVAGALLIALVAVASLLPVPYVLMSPGPTENTLGAYDGTDVIMIEGHDTYETEGRLDLTTVSATRADSELDLVGALQGWLNPKVAVVPRETVYPDDVAPDVVQQQNAEQMQSSQDNAIAAALRELDIPITARVFVGSIAEGAPALDRLQAGDAILAVDGQEVASPADVGALVTTHEPGEDVVFAVERDGEQLEVTVTTRAAMADEQEQGAPPRAVVGIVPTAGFEFPFDVTITLGEEIGGPSAGLVFALGIVDKLTPGALTNGAYVAGTGTIDADGVVGSIGGIQQKITAASDEGATVFLVPENNCAAAVAAEIDGIRLVRVGTLADARGALDSLATGDTAVPECAG